MDRKVEDDISEAEARATFESATEEIERIKRTHYEQQRLCDFLSYLPSPLVQERGAGFRNPGP
jgi:hypothetical protein